MKLRCHIVSISNCNFNEWNIDFANLTVHLNEGLLRIPLNRQTHIAVTSSLKRSRDEVTKSKF